MFAEPFAACGPLVFGDFCAAEFGPAAFAPAALGPCALGPGALRGVDGFLVVPPVAGRGLVLPPVGDAVGDFAGFAAGPDPAAGFAAELGGPDELPDTGLRSLDPAGRVVCALKPLLLSTTTRPIRTARQLVILFMATSILGPND